MQTKRLTLLLFFTGLIAVLFLDKHLSMLVVHGNTYKVVKVVSYCISPLFNAALWPLLFLVQLLRKKGWFMCYITASMGFAYILMYPIKMIIGRARPHLFFQKGMAGFHPLNLNHQLHSLPSGHAVISMAVFTALAYIYPRRSTLLLVIGMALPLTRVALGKHFLGDVLIGEAIGCLVATLFMGKITHIIYQFFGRIVGVTHDKSPSS
jgi:membrane-associated phospholipid phosphatase